MVDTQGNGRRPGRPGDLIQAVRGNQSPTGHFRSPSEASSPGLADSISASNEQACELCGSASRTRTASESSLATGPTSRVTRTCAPLWPTPTAGDYRGSRNATARRPNGNGQHNSGTTLTDALILAGELAMPETGVWPEGPLSCPCRCHTSMSSPAGSPAKTSPTPDVEKASQEHARVYGPTTHDSFANYDPATSSWKTSQLSLLEDYTSFSGTWPRAGMTRNGTAYRLVPSAPLTAATESGSLPTPAATSYGWNQGGSAGRTGPIRPSLEAMARHGLWPTPEASDGTGGRVAKELGGTRPSGSKRAITLATAVAQQWPTPTANRWDGLQSHGRNAISGSLNPTWVEWLMGFPTGWTDLEPSVTPSSPKSPNTSASGSSNGRPHDAS